MLISRPEFLRQRLVFKCRAAISTTRFAASSRASSPAFVSGDLQCAHGEVPCPVPGQIISCGVPMRIPQCKHFFVYEL
jgi:hypothetical protein